MFVVIGEALIDMVQPEPGDTFVAKVGGGPLNIAVGLQRLGHRTHMMARFSTGSLGALVRAHAEANGLDLSASVTTDDPTTLAFATLDEHRQASYDFYVHGTADWGWTDAELAQLPPDAVAAHTGSVAAAISPGADALLALWRRVARRGTSPAQLRPRTCAPRSWVNVTRPSLEQRRFVAVSHVVKASDEDLAWLYPDEDVTDVLRRWARTRTRTRRDDTRRKTDVLLRPGVAYRSRVPGIAVHVVDTIGAGDSFESGLLSGLADEGLLDLGGLGKLSGTQLEAVLAPRDNGFGSHVLPSGRRPTESIGLRRQPLTMHGAA